MREINIGLGERVVSRNPEDILVAYGLGSCVGVVMIDTVATVAGLLHAVLPKPADGNSRAGGGVSKYVEGGIEELVAAMLKEGASQHRLVIRIVGGANMLLSSGMTKSFDIGTRNVEAAQTTLNRLRMPIAAAEVGGHIGRTVRVYVANSRVTVRAIGKKEYEI